MDGGYALLSGSNVVEYQFSQWRKTNFAKDILRSVDSYMVLYVQEEVTQPKILNRTMLSNIIHVT